MLLGCQLYYVRNVMQIMSWRVVGLLRSRDGYAGGNVEILSIFVDYCGSADGNCATLPDISASILYIIKLTVMKRERSEKAKRAVDPKAEALRQQGTLHPNPEVVRDEAFQRDEFFDPRDLVQVRYEMLRRHKIDGDDVTQVAENFGISRQAYYVTEAAFEKKGIAGLLPRPRGPQRAHKCSNEVLDFVQQWHADASAPESVTQAVQKRFGISIHPRSLARALARRKKKLQ
jgi:transposase